MQSRESSQPDLSRRIARLEAIHDIQQLAVRYAMAVDARDVETWLGLFAADVDCGRRGRGREALRGFITPALKGFYRSVHAITGHVIDHLYEDHAQGRVYCRAEHEVGDRWIVMACVYHDRYARTDEGWRFVSRDEDFFYSHDLLERPQDCDFRRWPGPAPRHEPPLMLPRFADWAAFWADEDLSDLTRRP